MVPAPGFPSVVSPLVGAPFGRDARTIQELYFASAERQQVGDFTVYSDGGVGTLLLQELEIFTDENGNGIRDGREEVALNYTLRIFISKDASKLDAAFENTDPGPHDVCLYLEDNAGDVFSGTFARRVLGGGGIVVGDLIRDELATWFERSDDSGYRQFKALEEQFGFSVDYSRKQLKRLVDQGRVKSTHRTFGIGLLQLFNGLTVLAAPLNRAISDLLLGATATIRDVVHFKPQHWDPEAKSSANGSAPSSFTPVLFPVSPERLLTLASAGTSAAGEIGAGIGTHLEAWIRTNLGAFKTLHGRGLRAPKLPRYLKDFLAEAERMIAAAAKAAQASVTAVTSAWAALGTRAINAINAFFCGLWNGLVDAVLGIVDLVGYVFLGAAAAGDAIGTADEWIPALMETLDEALDALLSVDPGDLLSRAIDGLAAGISTLNPWAFTADISLERVAYFFGQLLGMIVEIVVSILYSGGIAGVRSAVQKAVRLFGAIGEGFVTAISAVFRTTVGAIEASIEGMVTLLRHLIDWLRSAGAQLRRTMDALVDELAALPQDLGRLARSRLGMSADLLDAIGELGLTITHVADGACQACRVRV